MPRYRVVVLVAGEIAHFFQVEAVNPSDATWEGLAKAAESGVNLSAVTRSKAFPIVNPTRMVA